jgi:hypothetical protein
MRQIVVRLGCLLLAAVNAAWGAWAYLWPEHFFSTFPGLGHHWTAAYPPFNDHLTVDLGATFLTMAFLLGSAAVARQTAVVRLALGAVLVFNALHLAFHALHRGELTGPDLAASLTTLVGGVLVPIVLLALARDHGRAGRPDRPDGADQAPTPAGPAQV